MDATKQQHGEWRKWGVFAAMLIAIFVPAFNTTSIVNAMIPIRNQFHLSASSLQWIINAYMLSVSILVVISGLLGDRFGRRRLFYVGSMIFIIGSVLSAVADGETLLLFGRACQGVGGSVILPCTLAIMKAHFPEEKQGLLNAGWAFAFGLGFALGPVVSGIILKHLAWPYLFWLTLAIVCVSMLVLFISVDCKETTNPTVKIDFLGLTVFMMGIIPFTFAIVNSTSWGWSSALTLGLLIPGAIFLLSLPLVERWVKGKPPLLRFSYYRIPIFALACVGQFVVGFVLIGLYFFIGIYLQNPLLANLNPFDAGFALLPTGIGLLMGAVISPYVRSRIGCFKEAVIIYLLFIFGLVWLICQSSDSPYSLMWIPLFVCGWGLGMSNASFPRMSLEQVPAEEAARASSLLNAHLYFSCILSTAFGVTIGLQLAGDDFIRDVKHIFVSPSDMRTIEQSLLGHSRNIEHIIHHYPQHAQAVMWHASKNAAWAGIRWALALSLAVVLIGLVLSSMTWRAERRTAQ